MPSHLLFQDTTSPARVRGAVALWLVVVAAVLCAPPAHAQVKSPPLRSGVTLAVHVAATGLSGLLTQTDDRELQASMIRDYVRTARFFDDETGYFFVYDSSGVCIANGIQPEIEGKNLLGYRDKAGFAVIKAIIELGQSGGGFVEYLWRHPDRKGTFEKLGYVEMIPDTDYIIGSGLYFHDIR